jgi:hypothetical protein
MATARSLERPTAGPSSSITKGRDKPADSDRSRVIRAILLPCVPGIWETTVRLGRPIAASIVRTTLFAALEFVKKVLPALVFMTMVTSCGVSGNQEAPAPLMEKGQTHLVFTWPAVRDEAPALTFRIPREDVDLSISPTRTDSGEIRTLFVKLKWPSDGVLVREMSSPRRDASAASRPPSNKLPWQSVELFRALNDSQQRREHYALWAYKCETCMADGQVGGLQRYSRMYCPDPASLPQRGQLAQREADDPSPPGCYLNRQGSYLSNSVQDDQGEQAIEVRCLSGHCEMSLQVRGRTVFTNINPKQLRYSTELAEAIRRQVSSYIVEPGQAPGRI